MSKKVNDDLKVELIGILSTIQLGDEWAERLKNNNFMEFISSNLSLGYVEVHACFILEFYNTTRMILSWKSLVYWRK